MLKEPGQLRGDGGREGREESLQCMYSRPVHSSQLVHHMGLCAWGRKGLLHHMGLCVWGRKGLLQGWTVCVGEEGIIARLDCVRGGGRDYCKAGLCVGEEGIIARLDCVRGGGRDYCKAGLCVGEEGIIARLDCVRGGGRDYCKAGVQWCSQVPSWSI